MSTPEGNESIVDQGGYTVRRTIHITAPIETVWSAVTDARHISRWFGQVVLSGREAGAEGTITFPGEGPVPIRVEAVDEPRMVSYRWNNTDGPDRPERLDDTTSTVFTFTLEPTSVGTRLTVVETGFEHTRAPREELESHRVGWNDELDKLVALVGGGQP